MIPENISQAAFAAVCQERDARIEITPNVVALFKLPMPVAKLAAIVDHMEGMHGKELRMMEKPKGWLHFFKP